MTWEWLDDTLLDRSKEKRARRALAEERSNAAERLAEGREAGKRGNDLEEIRQIGQYDVRLADEELDGLITRRLRREVDKRHLPLSAPNEDSDDWYESLDREWLLTNTGITKLTAAARADQFSKWQLPLSIVSLSIGVLGAATGFSAVLLALAYSGAPPQ